jgi:MerR family transcriptional regulator, copper efflux regulator
MNIGEAAKASGVSAKMIRCYEDIGLIPKPARLQSGHRHYAQEDAHTLTFIRRARDLGFSVDQIGELLARWHDRGRASADVKALVLEHVEQLRERIAALQAMARTLEHLAQHCHGDARPACPIIEDPTRAARSSPAPTRLKDRMRRRMGVGSGEHHRDGDAERRDESG